MAKQKKFLQAAERVGSQGGTEHSNYHFSVNMSGAEYAPVKDFLDLYGTSQKEVWRRLILFFGALPTPGKELVMKAGNIPSPGFEKSYATFMREWADRIENAGTIPAEYGAVLPRMTDRTTDEPTSKKR